MSIALIQISDLHFAHEFFPKGHRATVPANPQAAPLVAAQGLAAHDVAACEDLDNAVGAIFSDWAATGSPPSLKLLVITGDLTVCGDDSEFSLALTFVRGIVSDQRHGPKSPAIPDGAVFAEARPFRSGGTESSNPASSFRNRRVGRKARRCDRSAGLGHRQLRSG